MAMEDYEEAEKARPIRTRHCQLDVLPKRFLRFPLNVALRRCAKVSC